MTPLDRLPRCRRFGAITVLEVCRRCLTSEESESLPAESDVVLKEEPK